MKIRVGIFYFRSKTTSVQYFIYIYIYIYKRNKAKFEKKLFRLYNFQPLFLFAACLNISYLNLIKFSLTLNALSFSLTSLRQTNIVSVSLSLSLSFSLYLCLHCLKPLLSIATMQSFPLFVLCCSKPLTYQIELVWCIAPCVDRCPPFHK